MCKLGIAQSQVTTTDWLFLDGKTNSWATDVVIDFWMKQWDFFPNSFAKEVGKAAIKN